MPLTKKGEKIMKNMKNEYGAEKGEKVFYASANKGTIKGVHGKSKKLKKEDVYKYGTKEEIEFLKEEDNSWDTEYKELVNPAGHIKCPKCGGIPYMTSSSGSATGYLRAWNARCENNCGMIGGTAHEYPATKRTTYKSRLIRVVGDAWEKWDNGDITDWSREARQRLGH